MGAFGEQKMKPWIWVVTVAIPVVVAALFFMPELDGLDEETRKALFVLPKLNAIFNGTAFVCLLCAYYEIRRKNIKRHQFFTTSALVLSVLFLLSYVTFHLTTTSTPFGGEGWVRSAYFFVLISHILLSILVLPLVLFTYIRGLNRDVEKHRKIARWTWPLWLYVTATGVIVYLMISPYYPA